MSLLLVAIAMGGHCWYTCPNIICCLFYLSVGQIYCTNMYQQCWEATERLQRAGYDVLAGWKIVDLGNDEGWLDGEVVEMGFYNQTHKH